MNERRAVALLVELLQVNNELSRIMFRICHNLGSKQGNDMVRDDLARFILEVGVVNAEVGVKPVDFACDKLAGNEALHNKIGQMVIAMAKIGYYILLRRRHSRPTHVVPPCL